jgi:hypothetical protein
VFASIRYHAWWPGSSDPYYTFNSGENRTRINYYPSHPDGSYYVPYAWIDGIIRGGYSYNSWWNYILGQSGEDSPLEIVIGGTFDSLTRTGNLDIRLAATDIIEGTSLKLRIALTETNIHWTAPNGVTVHNETFRDMIPSATGTAVTIAQGETLYFHQAFTFPSTVNFHNGAIVVFVQADGNKEILNSAVRSLVEFPGSAIDDDPAVPSKFNLSQNYPNPFNAKTLIDYSIGKSSDVKLNVYDLAGRFVNTLYDGTQQAGHYQILWDGRDSNGNQIASGVYFYRLEAEGKNVTKRMVMLK